MLAIQTQLRGFEFSCHAQNAAIETARQLGRLILRRALRFRKFSLSPFSSKEKGEQMNNNQYQRNLAGKANQPDLSLPAALARHQQLIPCRFVRH